MNGVDIRREGVIKLATQVFGSHAAAMTWMHSPLPALAGNTSSNACETEEGTEEVIAILGRIEHGDFS